MEALKCAVSQTLAIYLMPGHEGLLGIIGASSYTFRVAGAAFGADRSGM